jgi:hypothetical protein
MQVTRQILSRELATLTLFCWGEVNALLRHFLTAHNANAFPELGNLAKNRVEMSSITSSDDPVGALLLFHGGVPVLHSGVGVV